MKFGSDQRVLWLSQVRSVPYRERVELAARHGYGTISTSPADYDRTLASGLSLTDIRNIASDHGVRLSYLDPMVFWVPQGLPSEGDEGLITYLDRSPDDFFRIAEELQVDRIHLIGAFPEGRYSIAELTEYYARTCQRAATYGLKCLIEAMPLWGLRKVEEVHQIVRDAAQPNSGIIFDTWHYTRAGRNDKIIAEIPAGMIDTVQIADGTKVAPAGRSNVIDCLSYRVPIGDGELANKDILELLRDAGHLTSVGPEIFSAALDKLPGEEIMALIQPGFDSLLESL
ncbi:TIM barrel protein [Ensifer sp. T173]|uniref:TIM barrel protein n=1 Tax=Ensifer canadensis TaxID=555315 RepID=A0AAW4FK76_9HYPH|nr:sugar phosphate isomerase/epimerase family protein [Ensifer canadensis]MBM3092442.1 TIM barrel protein [Ensifer canadensis]UBI73992.1 sugar phosphate isomerase/epimerase [Ensifer canadensis]